MRVQPTEAARRRLLAAIEGDPQAAPILATVWGAVAYSSTSPADGPTVTTSCSLLRTSPIVPPTRCGSDRRRSRRRTIDTDRHHQRRRIRWHQTSTATRGRPSKGNLRD